MPGHKLSASSLNKDAARFANDKYRVITSFMTAADQFIKSG